jgi:hypothetical protein
MWQLISDNAAALTVIATAATLIVWTVYGQILSANQSRQQKTRLFITQGNGSGLDSTCLLSNMGKEFVFLRGVFVDLHESDGGHHTAPVEKEWQAQPRSYSAEDIGQGPVGSSQQLVLGPFRWLVAEAARKAGLLQADDDAELWQRFRQRPDTARPGRHPPAHLAPRCALAAPALTDHDRKPRHRAPDLTTDDPQHAAGCIHARQPPPGNIRRTHVGMDQ